MQRNIIVIGSANTDLVIAADRFPRPGETLLGHGFMTNHGGKGANQAVAAARAGGSVAFVGRVGDDSFGHSTVLTLTREGIDVSGLLVSQGASTGVALITTVPGGENTIVVDAGANGLLKPEDVEQSEQLFAPSSIVLMQLETPVNALVRAAEMAKAHGAMVVLNPAPAPVSPLPEALLKAVDLLIPNQTEAALIAGRPVSDTESASRAIETLRNMGVKDAIITLGSKGSYAEVGSERLSVPALTVQAVDTTAAGDTFCGALCAALSMGQAMADAMQFATKAAAVSVTRRGAQRSMPTLKEICSTP